MRLGRPRGRGRGRGPPQQQAAALLRVTVHLDAEKRGWVIGAQGATVKATQKATGARITLPQRGVDGPTSVEGPTPLSVLRACALIARQAAAECQCTCSLAGSTELIATLHPTGAETHRLFELAADSPVAFVAYVLQVPSPAGHDPAGRAAELLAVHAACWLDDAAFTAGAGAMATLTPTSTPTPTPTPTLTPTLTLTRRVPPRPASRAAPPVRALPLGRQG